MTDEAITRLYDMLVLLLLLSIPIGLTGLVLAYRLIRGYRWRQKEILHTSIAILNTNQAILALLLRLAPQDKHPARHQTPSPGQRARVNGEKPEPVAQGEARGVRPTVEGKGPS